MADEFLTVETEAAPAPAKPKGKRGPMSEAHKEKIRASNKATRERIEAKKAPRAPNVKTGLTAEDAEEIRQELRLKAAEEKIKEAAISEDNRLMVHQEIKIDVMNTLRRFVELTPSMCKIAKNCPFDAAKEAGASDWHAAPIGQVMSDGRTLGDRLIAMREYHEATAHTVQQATDHIITAGELSRRQWNPGQSISNEFLTGAK